MFALDRLLQYRDEPFKIFPDKIMHCILHNFETIDSVKAPVAELIGLYGDQFCFFRHCLDICTWQEDDAFGCT